MKKISIIIPTYNNLGLTKKCLASIRKNTTRGQYEIIVVDNASKDKTPDFIKTQKEITAVLNKENKNFAGACNQGAGVAKNDILLFLNNDTEVHPGWLEPIQKVLASEKKIGAVGVKLLFPNGKVQHAGVAFFESKVPEHIYRLRPAGKKYVNKRREFQAVTAACIAIPKKVFKAVGGFDEYYKNGYEDVDLCLKIGKAGYRIIYEPGSVITHHESVSTGRHDYNISNLDLLISRWYKVKSDANNYFKEDGFGPLWRLYYNIKYMAYVPEKYGTIPQHILRLRKVYLVYIKVGSFFKKCLKRALG